MSRHRLTKLEAEAGRLGIRLRDLSIDLCVFAQELEHFFVQSLARGFVVEAVAFLRLQAAQKLAPNSRNEPRSQA